MNTHRRKRCQIIAEVAQAHDGSLGMAHAYIDAAADAGATAVKFQCHIADAESTPLEPWRTKFSLQDASRFEYWKRMQFSEEHWFGLKRHCDKKGVDFLCSPFSPEAVSLLTRVGVSAWKIASGEVANAQMFAQIAESRLPVLLSTGMSDTAEIDEAVNRVKSYGLPLTVLQCTSAYPCPPEKIGLNLIPYFRDRYDCGVGLSDHSGTIYAGLAAATLGIDVLEVHVTFSRQIFGPDVTSSVTTDEFAQLVGGVRFIERINANPVDKDLAARETAHLRPLFTKSVFASKDLPLGGILGEEDLAVKKPGTGIPATRLSKLVGKKLRRDVPANTMLAEEDLE